MRSRPAWYTRANSRIGSKFIEKPCLEHPLPKEILLIQWTQTKFGNTFSPLYMWLPHLWSQLTTCQNYLENIKIMLTMYIQTSFLAIMTSTVQDNNYLLGTHWIRYHTQPREDQVHGIICAGYMQILNMYAYGYLQGSWNKGTVDTERQLCQVSRFDILSANNKQWDYISP